MSIPSKNHIRKDLRETLKRKLSSVRTQDLRSRLESTLARVPGLKVLGVFSPLPDEPDLRPFFQGPLSYLLAFPWMLGEKMEFRVSPYEDLVKQPWKSQDFPMPSQDSERVVPEVLLIPFLGVNGEGYRLGRGGGYYDRYLAQYRGLRVGVGFEFQSDCDFEPEPHDQKLHLTVTDVRHHFYELELQETWERGLPLPCVFPDSEESQLREKKKRSS